MTKEEFITYVPKELILNPETTGLDIMTYNICNMYGVNFFKDPIYITPAFIAGQLGDLLNYRSKVTKSLLYLADKYPNLLNETEIPKTFKLDMNKKPNIPMVHVPYTEVQTILKSGYSYNYDLLKLFYVIIASFKSEINHYKGTNYGINWYAIQMGLSYKTISLYMTCLKNIGLLYIFQDNNRQTNLIGRYSDRKTLKEWAIQNGYMGGSRSSSNEARSLMMKYHQIEKGKGTKYSPSEINQIKSYIKWYNETHEDKKDMSVFDTINN